MVQPGLAKARAGTAETTSDASENSKPETPSTIDSALDGGTKIRRTTSPYFDIASPSTPSSSKILECWNSPFFAKAPSSVYGSVHSLGSIVSTWLPPGFDIPKCTRRHNPVQGTSQPEAICPSCRNVLIKALQPFSICSRVDTGAILAALAPSPSWTSDRGQSRNDPCWKHCDSQLETHLRHLCVHRCYLRAFAPCRDWMALRQAIYRVRPGKPLSTMLKGWSCHVAPLPLISGDTGNDGDDTIKMNGDYLGLSLAVEESNGTSLLEDRENAAGRKRKTITERTTSRPSRHLLTVFVCRYQGERCFYYSIVQALRALGVILTGTNETKNSSGCIGDDEVVLTMKKIRRLTKDAPSLSKRRLQFAHAAVNCGVRGGDISSRRVTPTTMFGRGVSSPLGLIEELFSDNPWRLLVSTILLNRTQRVQVDHVLHTFLQRWPTPQSVLEEVNTINVDSEGYEDLVGRNSVHKNLTLALSPLGIKHRRARGIVRFCREYLDLAKELAGTTQATSDVEFRWTRDQIISLYYCGDYAADAYQLFVLQDWKTCQPKDHALRAYVEWKRSLAADKK